MADLETIPPPRRPELLVRPLGDDGQHVVKDPGTGAYYNLGEVESFLLLRLDGRQTVGTICSAFAEKFGEALAPNDLDEFVTMARGQGFLQPAVPESAVRAAPAAAAPAPAPAPKRKRQSLLYWRFRFFDPDRLFTWLEPKLAFCWTRAFVLFSLTCVLAAAAVFGANLHDYFAFLPSALHFKTVVLMWATIVVVTLGHEFAHGLTCKHHGGEVHEVGFLLIFFMPCFYCNVSDAWLIREKSKRLWVTLAGGYHDLFIWALAVLVWRLTLESTVVHYTAWVVMAVCGVRVFINFNPLFRLDGYYLLSDWVEMPNLRPRSLTCMMAHVRWWLWGAARPEREERGRLLLTYGVTSWLFSMAYLALMFAGFFYLFGRHWGVPGLAGVAVLAYVILPKMFRGFTAGEVAKMFRVRRKRVLVWGSILAGVPALLFLVHIEDKATGQFRIRPTTRAEVRAPVSGFLQVVYLDEGARVSPGMQVGRMDIPDLDSKLAQKRAELAEARAKLKLLKIGPRPEEIAEQRERVRRSKSWRDLARQDLDRKDRALSEELTRLHEQATQKRAELVSARENLQRGRRLREQRALSGEEFEKLEKECHVTQAQLEQALAQKRERVTVGTLEAEAELARRQKDLADAQAALNLLEAGTRPEEIEAEEARLRRLEEERRYLEGQRGKLRLASPVPGLITTPHLREKVGQFFKEGDLICEVEEPCTLEAEIAVEEQDVARVELGQAVEMKARALPFETFHGRVERVAPVAAKAEKTDVQSAVTVGCRLQGGDAALRPGMTGHARIYCGRRPVGEILGRSILRFLRTEFWW